MIVVTLDFPAQRIFLHKLGTRTVHQASRMMTRTFKAMRTRTKTGQFIVIVPEDKDKLSQQADDRVVGNISILFK